ncbi:hypothetical protein D3C72_1155680 [compost metagenome]
MPICDAVGITDIVAPGATLALIIMTWLDDCAVPGDSVAPDSSVVMPTLPVPARVPFTVSRPFNFVPESVSVLPSATFTAPTVMVPWVVKSVLTFSVLMPPELAMVRLC